MTLNKNTYNNNNNNNNDIDNIDYKKAYIRMVNKLNDAVNTINASDYSKKSLGQFKEKVERILYKSKKILK